MTILPKPSLEKKAEKIFLPLPGFGGRNDTYHRNLLEHQNSYNSSEADVESMVFNRPQFSCLKTILLFLISITVMLTGALGGYTLYHMYAPTHTRMHYRALCDIPYEPIGNDTAPRIYPRGEDLGWLWPHFTGEKIENLGDALDDTFFREEIEMDMDDTESYAKVDVPDFKDSRRGRFMHDFKENQSAIIDSTANRCFIMPLDRETVLPPENFVDLMKKMVSGYYNIDTERVRRTMRVVTPPITDLSTISERIANECYDMRIYKLERYESGVYKREAKLDSTATYAEYLGKGIVQFNIMNIDDVEEYERQYPK
uniref:Integral membrane protein 2 n=1 Tax=Glossina brevipalpis TaxID=37001 RepID=A0A1A9WW17_9MUSC